MSENKIEDFIKFSFEGTDVRIVDRDGNKWFIAKDWCNLLGIKNVSDACKDLDDDEKGIVIIDTPGGPQKSIILSESGVNWFILKSRKPEARKIQKWLSKEVMPQLRKTGSYSIKPKTELEMLQIAVNQLVEQRKELDEHKKDIFKIKEDVNELKEDKKRAAEQLSLLPESELDAAKKSTRSLLNQRVRKYCQLYVVDYRACWKTIYTEYSYRYHMNVKVRATNRGMKVLDYVESIGMMEELYAIACDICVVTEIE